MAKDEATQPDAPRADGAHDDPTFDTTSPDPAADVTSDVTSDSQATTELEQTVQTEQTEQLDTRPASPGSTDPTEQLDTAEATRAIEVDEPATSRDLFGNPVGGDVRSEPADPAYAPVEQPTTTLPERPSGPHAPAIVLGLVCLAVAGIILGQELGDLSVDWGDIGPVGIVVTGAVLVLFGLVGLLTSRRGSKTP